MAEIKLSEAVSKLRRLDTAILRALETDVADGFKQAISESVHKNVYSVGEPNEIYGRREDEGGLSDTDNYDTSADGGDGEYTLSLHNGTPFQQFYGGTPPTYTTLTEVIETGNPNFYQYYVGARPFMDKGRDQFVDSGDAEKYLTQGLKKQGY